ncbi:MAG: hypothetical protein MUF73_18230, partial [Rhodobacteraceae bacterium]|nr:hypothetical protein [Paracoccaceae bacterium]
AGLASRQHIWDKHYLDFFREVVKTSPEGYSAVRKSAAELEADAQRLLQEVKTAYADARDLLVSCWHMNSAESEALWQIYCSPGSPGVAIRSDLDRLWTATGERSGALIGKVHYRDFRREFSLGDDRIFCKRSSLAHEREVRIVLPNDGKEVVDGFLLPCDISSLISEVVISPYASPWFREVVEKTTSSLGYSLAIKNSETLQAPFY